MFAIALIVSLICLAIPVSTFIRMVITGRHIYTETEGRMSAYHRINARWP